MLEQRLKNYKPYAFGGACSFYLGAIIISLLIQALAGIVSASLATQMPDIASNGDFNTAFMIAFQVANAAFIVLFSYVKKSKFNFCYIKDERTGKGITPACIIAPVIGGAVLMAAMYLPTVWYGYLIRAIGMDPDAGNIAVDTPASYAMIIISSVLLAPVFEETIYRGVLFHGLKSELSAVKAILMSALAFMLMHMSPMQVVFQFALGVTAAYLVCRSGRVLPAVILHAAANAFALVMQMTPLADALIGCELWLTQNVAAAVFITLGLFAAGGAVIYFGGAFLFGGKSERAGEQKADEPIVIDGTDGDIIVESGDIESVRDKAVRAVRKKEGLFKYFIAIGISFVMFTINLVSGIMS